MVVMVFLMDQLVMRIWKKIKRIYAKIISPMSIKRIVQKKRIVNPSNSAFHVNHISLVTDQHLAIE